jgi:large subunit ribosomal protein L4
MKVNIVSLSSDKKSSQELNDSIYGLDPRSDILHRVVTWQLSKRRSGTHKVKERGEIKGSTKKIMAQKGSGGARHSTRKVNLFRGGGVAFGPKPRDYSTKLPKKIRTLGLKHALSAKVKNDELIILDEAKLASPKTKDLVSKIKKLKLEDALFIDLKEFDKNFELAIKNIKGLELINIEGINVYDILRKEKLVLTKRSVEMLNERLQ